MPPTPADPAAYAWLPTADTLAWLQLDEGNALAGVADWCRQASASYCQDQRPDLLSIDETDPENPVATFTATPNVIMAGLIGAARIYARRSTPAGLASFGEFGASEVLRLDPDVARLLGTGRHAAPAVG